ncbi:GTPase [Roseofilum sp. Guam]|uniref:GTPase n=1 Tax=Roseofilum sp. Guam TaxID=2821502 RepID=UPI001B295912|nr:GTPase [Roseofilum sp. Guam]MBP0028177.1 50S ribosome-binding GTPase [Roseofilum sp. Guam]
MDFEEFEIHKIFSEIIKAKNRGFTFLLVGRTGVGKSSTVNTLMGKKVCKVGDDEPVTFSVKSFDTQMAEIPFWVIDTPGLCDEIEGQNDAEYISKIKSSIDLRKVDCLWFVTPLHETRVRSDEKRAIRLISESFGSGIWGLSIIVFTFAGFVERNDFPEKLRKRTELIRAEIAQYVGEEVAELIPSVAVDNKSKTTPDSEFWLGELYTTVFKRMKMDAMLPYLMVTIERFKPTPRKPPGGTIHAMGVDSGKPAQNTNVNNESVESPPTGSDIPLNSKQEQAIGDRIATALNIVGTGAEVLSKVIDAAKKAAPYIRKFAGNLVAFLGKLRK